MSPWISTTAFCLGYLFQAVRYVRSRTEAVGFVTMVITVLILSLLIMSGEITKGFVLIYVFFFTIVFFQFFKHHVIPKTNEGVMLIYALVIGYYIVAVPHSSWYPVMFGIVIAIALTSMFPAFYAVPFGNRAQTLFYGIYLVEVLTLGILQMNDGSFATLLGSPISNVHPINAFFSGVVFFSLAMRAMGVFYFLPFTRDKQGLHERLREIKEYIHLFPEKYEDTQLRIAQTFLIISIVTLLLFLNTHFTLLPDYAVIDGIILFAPLLFSDRQNVLNTKKLNSNLFENS